MLRYFLSHAYIPNDVTLWDLPLMHWHMAFMKSKSSLKKLASFLASIAAMLSVMPHFPCRGHASLSLKNCM